MSKKWKVVIVVLVVVAVAAGVVIKRAKKGKNYEITGEVMVSRGNIQSFISTTGTVQPQNRLEIKPPISGRIEEILVEEGDHVEAGDILAWMSSTERAALLDAARPQGEEAMEYWRNVYKPAPLIAPIDGEVIVRAVEPGQTVTSGDAVIVLSDRLIVHAQVDETDIGKVEIGQPAFVTLDAYPDTKVDAVVDHIAYESRTVSNVTIYEVDILPAEVPEFFRSGMSATVEILAQNKENVLILPYRAIQQDRAGSYVYVREDGSRVPVPRDIETGISDDRGVEVVSGIVADDTVVIVKRKFDPSKAKGKKNPFLPFSRTRRGKPESHRANRALH